MQIINSYIVSDESVHKHSELFIPVQDRRQYCEIFECENANYFVRVSGSISKLDKESFEKILSDTMVE